MSGEPSSSMRSEVSLSIGVLPSVPKTDLEEYIRGDSCAHSEAHSDEVSDKPNLGMRTSRGHRFVVSDIYENRTECCGGFIACDSVNPLLWLCCVLVVVGILILANALIMHGNGWLCRRDCD